MPGLTNVIYFFLTPELCCLGWLVPADVLECKKEGEAAVQTGGKETGEQAMGTYLGGTKSSVLDLGYSKISITLDKEKQTTQKGSHCLGLVGWQRRLCPGCIPCNAAFQWCVCSLSYQRSWWNQPAALCRLAQTHPVCSLKSAQKWSLITHLPHNLSQQRSSKRLRALKPLLMARETEICFHTLYHIRSKFPATLPPPRAWRGQLAGIVSVFQINGTLLWPDFLGQTFATFKKAQTVTWPLYYIISLSLLSNWLILAFISPFHCSHNLFYFLQHCLLFPHFE